MDKNITSGIETRTQKRLQNKTISALEKQIEEKDDSIRTYEKLICNIDRKLKDKERLILTLEDEYEQNSLEFEKLCKENQLLKKHLAEKEAFIIDLQNDLITMETVNSKVNEDYEEVINLNNNIMTPYKKQLNEINMENRLLQVKLNQITDEYNNVRTILESKNYSSVNIKGSSVYKNRKLFKKIGQQNKKIKKLQKEYTQLQRETCQPIEIHNSKMNYRNYLTKPSKTTENDNNKIKTIEKSCQEKGKILIFSGKTGKGLGEYFKRICYRYNSVTNICKPFAGPDKILENYSTHVSGFGKNDLVIIFIDEYSQKQTMNIYPQLLSKILNTDRSREYELLIMSIKYDKRNDYEIYDINKQLHSLAINYNKIKYFESNDIYRGVILQKEKRLAISQMINNKFHNSSSFTFPTYSNENCKTSHQNFIKQTSREMKK